MTDLEESSCKFKEAVEFADKLVNMLCCRPRQKPIICDAICAVLEAHVLTLTGQNENAELILSAAYSRVGECFSNPEESWNMILRISAKLNSIAESFAGSDADVIFAAKCLRSRFVDKLLWWQNNTSAFILIKYMRMSYYDCFKIAASILREKNLRYYAKVGIWVHLIVPVGLNILALGIWSEPHSFWLRAFAIVPCFSWIIAFIGLAGKFTDTVVKFDVGFGFWICSVPFLLMLMVLLSGMIMQLDEGQKKIKELHRKLKDEIVKHKGASS